MDLQPVHAHKIKGTLPIEIIEGIMNENKLMQLSLILFILTQSAKDLIIEFSMAVSRGLMTFISPYGECSDTRIKANAEDAAGSRI